MTNILIYKHTRFFFFLNYMQVAYLDNWSMGPAP